MKDKLINLAMSIIFMSVLILMSAFDSIVELF